MANPSMQDYTCLLNHVNTIKCIRFKNIFTKSTRGFLTICLLIEYFVTMVTWVGGKGVQHGWFQIFAWWRFIFWTIICVSRWGTELTALHRGGRNNPYSLTTLTMWLFLTAYTLPYHLWTKLFWNYFKQVQGCNPTHFWFKTILQIWFKTLSQYLFVNVKSCVNLLEILQKFKFTQTCPTLLLCMLVTIYVKMYFLKITWQITLKNIVSLTTFLKKMPLHFF